MFISIFMILLTVTRNMLAEPTCFDANNENLKLHLATKTPYRFIFNRNDSVVTYTDCQPRRIWSIIRHGTRYPKREVIDAINVHLTNIRNEIFEKGNPQLCPQDTQKLRSWKSVLDAGEEKYLTYEGIDELLELAERLQKRFPSILPEGYSQDVYKFKFTGTQRTLKSFEGFATGLFGRHNLSKIQFLQSSKKDPILRFYKLCSKWAIDVDDNPEALHEPREWLNSDDMNNLLHDIRMKLCTENLSKVLFVQNLENISIHFAYQQGFHVQILHLSITVYNRLLQINDIRNLTADIILMYTVCGFETAWYKLQYSPWCSIFNETQLKMLEFYTDLKHYWNDGYGFPINYHQACPAIRDMIDHLDLNSTQPNSTFYFTHSGTMLKLLAHLGLYKDDFVLSHRDFDKERKWHVGNIDAFASNLVFVTFECTTEPHVLLLHQEKIIKLPGCPLDSDLCSMATIKNIFHSSLHQCDFDDFCENPKSSNLN